MKHLDSEQRADKARKVCCGDDRYVKVALDALADGVEDTHGVTGGDGTREMAKIKVRRMPRLREREMGAAKHCHGDGLAREPLKSATST